MRNIAEFMLCNVRKYYKKTYINVYFECTLLNTHPFHPLSCVTLYVDTKINAIECNKGRTLSAILSTAACKFTWRVPNHKKLYVGVARECEPALPIVEAVYNVRQ